jgi:hypothetical protein
MRTHAVRDTALERAAGADEDEEDASEWNASEALRIRWRKLNLAKRKEALRLEIAMRFRKRFGFDWRTDWNQFVSTTEVRLGPTKEYRRAFRAEYGFDLPAEWWPQQTVTMGPPSMSTIVPQKVAKGARSHSERSRFVALWDRYNIMNLPARKTRSQGGSDARFKSVIELTWISILGGNWPPAARMRGPDAVLRAERTLIKEALDRYGQKPIEARDGEKYRKVRIQRGPRVRVRLPKDGA